MSTYLDGVHPERMKRAIRDGCLAYGPHFPCLYPECECTQVPNTVRAAIASWEALPDTGGPFTMTQEPELPLWKFLLMTYAPIILLGVGPVLGLAAACWVGGPCR